MHGDDKPTPGSSAWQAICLWCGAVTEFRGQTGILLILRPDWRSQHTDLYCDEGSLVETHFPSKLDPWSERVPPKMTLGHLRMGASRVD